MQLIDFERLERDAGKLKSAFQSASPFEFVVIDDFLTREGLKSILVAIPNPESVDKSSDFMFAKNKFENPRIESIDPIFRQYRDELLSDQFRDLLCQITDKNVFVDQDFVGGGLHQGGSGSFLDMHCDFTRHPDRRDWIRELNLLLYLNPDYRDEWGGCLDLCHKKTGVISSIAPIVNRMVIMLTKPHTLHGYKPIQFPEDVYRTSIAAYAYQQGTEDSDVEYKSTQWFPESASKRFWARLSEPLVIAKQRIFGSRTAKRANRK